MSKKAVIFSAPSGSGKTTIVKQQLQLFPELTFSISATTRSPRQGEVNGKDYYFLTEKEFSQHIADDNFIEYEEVYTGTFYGTLKSEVERIWDQQKVVIFDVDVVGGLNLKKYFGGKAMSIFIKPPSLQALEQRLKSRGTESDDSLATRLGKASHELTFEKDFDLSIENDILEEAISSTKDRITEFLTK